MWGKGSADKTEQYLPIARAQAKLGLRINIDATSCLYSFYNGSSETAHITKDGKPFFDDSFGKKSMGCPFAIDHRQEDIRDNLLPFIKNYAKEGLKVDFLFADWEVDGPIEWNNAWEASKQCKRCCAHIPEIDNFFAFQKKIRDKRSDLQRSVYAETILDAFPQALVGNYAVYSHNGFRYWYDYFEKYVDGQPALTDHRAKYRHWANEFEQCGYTYAMPVVYTWYPTYNWYDFENKDYRWFYNMLLVGSNPAEYTAANIPIITFVHWHTTAPPENPDPAIKQMSKWAYQELLWHLLLRGHDTFFLWAPRNEFAAEIKLLHPVWAEAQQFGEFLEKGIPINFSTPDKPGTIISGLRHKNLILLRRTDFAGNTNPVAIKIKNKTINIKLLPGKCQIIEL